MQQLKESSEFLPGRGWGEKMKVKKVQEEFSDDEDGVNVDISNWRTGNQNISAQKSV